jgi:hypothetical protein
LDNQLPTAVSLAFPFPPGGAVGRRVARPWGMAVVRQFAAGPAAEEAADVPVAGRQPPKPGE